MHTKLYSIKIISLIFLVKNTQKQSNYQNDVICEKSILINILKGGMKKTFDIGPYHSDGKRIGSGAYSTVYKGYNIVTGELVAIKVVDLYHLTSREPQKKENLKTRLKIEIKIAQSTDHPNLVKMLDVFEEEERVYLVFEFCDGGDLSKFLQKRGILSETEAREYLQQIVSGMEYLMMNDIIHRDLKPQNILMKKTVNSSFCPYILKIADFGFAKQTDPDILSATVCGSPLYMAPELLKMCPYSTKADLWSLGVILYEMVTGNQPIQAKSAIELVANIQTHKIRIPSYLSKECKSLLMGLLRKREDGRMCIKDVTQHSFLKSPTSTPPKTSTFPSSSRDDNSSPFTATHLTLSPASKPIRICSTPNIALPEICPESLNSIDIEHSSISSDSTLMSFSSTSTSSSALIPSSLRQSNVKINIRTICETFYGIEELQRITLDLSSPKILVYIYVQCLKMIRDLVNNVAQKINDDELRPSHKINKIIERCIYRYEQLRIATLQLKDHINPEDTAPCLSTLILQHVVLSETQANDPRTDTKTAYKYINSSIILLILLQNQKYFPINEENVDREISRLLRKKKFLKKKGSLSFSSFSL